MRVFGHPHSPGGLRSQSCCRSGGGFGQPDCTSSYSVIHTNLNNHCNCIDHGLGNYHDYVDRNRNSHGFDNLVCHAHLYHHLDVDFDFIEYTIRYTSLSNNRMAHNDYDTDTDGHGDAALHDNSLAQPESCQCLCNLDTTLLLYGLSFCFTEY